MALVIWRRVGEKIYIGEDCAIDVKITRIRKRRQVAISIRAPRNVKISRGEKLDIKGVSDAQSDEP